MLVIQNLRELAIAFLAWMIWGWWSVPVTFFSLLALNAFEAWLLHKMQARLEAKIVKSWSRF